MVRRGNKKKKLIIIGYILSIICTIFSSSVLLIYEKNSTENTYKENVEQVLQTASNIVDEKINGYEQVLDNIMKNSNLVNLASVKRDMEILNANDSTILNIYYIDEASGTFTGALDVVFEDVTDARVDFEWYEQVKAEPDRLFISEVYDDELTGRPTVTLNLGAEQNGMFYGALSVDIDLTYLEEEISLFKYGETGEIEVIDDFGTMAVHRDQSKIGSNEPTNYSVWNDILNNTSGKVKFEYNSIDYEGYYTSYDKMYWKLLIKNDVNEISASINAQKKIIFGIAFAALVLQTIVFMIAIKDNKKKYKA